MGQAFLNVGALKKILESFENSLKVIEIGQE